MMFAPSWQASAGCPGQRAVPLPGSDQFLQGGARVKADPVTLASHASRYSTCSGHVTGRLSWTVGVHSSWQGTWTTALASHASHGMLAVY